MNANAQAWVNALRSGKYKQGQQQLREEDAYCCLGVACELYRLRERHGKWNKDGEFMGAYTMLPEPVRLWLGLAQADGGGFSGDRLTNMNDRGSSFAEIADVIESEPEGLFT